LTVPERICAVIPAAGLSRRMGRCKQLLPLGGDTVIVRTVQAALRGGAESVVVVTGQYRQAVEDALAPLGERVTCVYNAAYAETDMLHSVQLGVAALPDCDAFFLLPGDMPAVSAATFAAVRRCWSENQNAVVFPVFSGRKGHPVLIPRRYRALILSYAGTDGLRGLWHTCDTACAQVADSGAVLDMDTPESYEQVKRTLSQINRLEREEL